MEMIEGEEAHDAPHHKASQPWSPSWHYKLQAAKQDGKEVMENRRESPLSTKWWAELSETMLDCIEGMTPPP